ncbi:MULTISPECIES: DUF4247 domain-containing protein [unclassified Corynebacterium]|uniref:DUF4247 domain-containing protein n=1 Tax=unclassified Corynebacterium TaxID=2624378 RepID=UPI0029C9CEE7|nr:MULTISPECIES: DUF4247 domain-containing protein [unclassified Corynebacterium]WPF65375.1 DUF4247 domain-containing protein [Corynebacterium sp. 22KM0430]WPF67870.1 DUF4247 domain-containing protein [Corynebacterium sp. 21KM1197]
MKPFHYYVAAVCCALLAVILLVVRSSDTAVGDAVPQHFERAQGNTFYCHDDPNAVADEIERHAGSARSRATDEATGAVYLRYKNNVVEITGSGEDCRINVEDLGRMNSGAFVYLGPGFSPGSPSNSSGGSSGSGSGVGSVK